MKGREPSVSGSRGRLDLYDIVARHLHDGSEQESEVDDEGRYGIEQVVEGDRVEDVLSYVQYDRRLLVVLRDGSEVIASRAGSQRLRELAE